MCDLWSFVLLFLFVYGAFAADRVGSREDGMVDFEDESVSGYKSHTNIKTKWQFVDRSPYPIEKAPFAKAYLSPSKQFYKLPLTESTSILLTLRNLGDFTFNISSISGYLHAAHRFSFFVQNSTTRPIHSLLGPHSEMTLEYRFVPWTGLPAVDYVLSGDVEYAVIVPPKSGIESDPISIEYSNQFMNTTVSIYESNPFRYLDFELLLMVVLIVLFWTLVAILFYEFWWIPNQMAQGKQPLPTHEFVVLCYERYLQSILYDLREKLLNKPNPLKSKKGNNAGNGSRNNSRSGSTTPSRSQKNDWLQGTAIRGNTTRSSRKIGGRKKGKKSN